GISAQSYNLDTLFIWTLLFGLVNQAGDGRAEGDTELAPICRTLWDDLGAIDPWFLPVKEGVAGKSRQASQIVGVGWVGRLEFANSEKGSGKTHAAQSDSSCNRRRQITPGHG